jgi:hypothetical protein
MIAKNIDFFVNFYILTVVLTLKTPTNSAVPPFRKWLRLSLVRRLCELPKCRACCRGYAKKLYASHRETSSDIRAFRQLPMSKALLPVFRPSRS